MDPNTPEDEPIQPKDTTSHTQNPPANDEAEKVVETPENPSKPDQEALDLPNPEVTAKPINSNSRAIARPTIADDPEDENQEKEENQMFAKKKNKRVKLVLDENLVRSSVLELFEKINKAVADDDALILQKKPGDLTSSFQADFAASHRNQTQKRTLRASFSGFRWTRVFGTNDPAIAQRVPSESNFPGKSAVADFGFAGDVRQHPKEFSRQNNDHFGEIRRRNFGECANDQTNQGKMVPDFVSGELRVQNGR